MLKPSKVLSIMERYKYSFFCYFWIFLVFLQQDIWSSNADETTQYDHVSTLPVTPTKPNEVDATRKPKLTTKQLQIPGHRFKTIPTSLPRRVTIPPIVVTKRLTRKPVLTTTEMPITIKPIVSNEIIPATTRSKDSLATRFPTGKPTVEVIQPAKPAPIDPIESDGVQVIYHCSFELNEHCRFLQDTHDELDWQIERDPTPSTTSSNGRFAHLTPRKSITQPVGGRAQIATPYMEAPTGYVDLSFLYHIFNENPELLEGILNVFACKKQLVWSSSASWGNHWFKADIKITCTEGFRIIFEGVIGGVKIDIAIDDVSVTGPGGKPETIPTTTILSTTEEEFSTTTSSITPSIDPPIVSGGNETELGTDTKISPKTAVSLVTLSVALFVTTVIMLLVSMVIHARVCSKRARYPAHIIYHGPEYFNRGTDGDQTAYMTLNFKEGTHSSGTGTGTEVLTLSDRHSGPSPLDRSSWEQVIMRDMKPVRRESKTFPIMKEIKHLLEAVHMRRIRTLSAHLSRAEVETLRRQFTPDNTQDTTQDSGTHERTRSTVALERTESSIRPLSEISEHFYYSLFPDPRNRPDRIRPDSGLSGLSQFNNGFENENGKGRASRQSSGSRSRSLRRSASRPLSSPAIGPRSVSYSRPRDVSSESSPEAQRDKDKEQSKVLVDDIEIIDETKEEDRVEVVDQMILEVEEIESDVSDQGEAAETESLAPETTEMVDNEIYEPYSGDVESGPENNT